MADKVTKIIFFNSPSEVGDYLASEKNNFITNEIVTISGEE